MIHFRYSEELFSLRITQSKTIANLAATRHTEPARLRKLIAGDLDCIVMKALEKDRRRRYGTASDLASDLLRHIAGEGVLAAPPTAAYRTRKFVRKYRVALATTAAIVLSLVAGVMVSTFEAIRAGKAELNARKQTIEANNQKLAADTAATVATKAELQSIIGMESVRMRPAARMQRFYGSQRRRPCRRHFRASMP